LTAIGCLLRPLKAKWPSWASCEAGAWPHKVRRNPPRRRRGEADSPETGVAHLAAGLICWFASDYREARDHFEWALTLFQPGRDDDLAFRFGIDPGVAAMAYLVAALWPLGESAARFRLTIVCWRGQRRSIGRGSRLGTTCGALDAWMALLRALASLPARSSSHFRS
jgi:hypothetical protein